MFKITLGKGFHITFPENGFTVSVQFGFGNYCENQHDMELKEYLPDRSKLKSRIACPNAEVAIFDKLGTCYRLDGDSLILDDSHVSCWQTAQEVAHIIHVVSQWKPQQKE